MSDRLRVACVLFVAALASCTGDFTQCDPDAGLPDGGDPCHANPDDPETVICKAKCKHVAECSGTPVAENCVESCVTIIRTADATGDPDQRPLYECEGTTPCEQLPSCRSP